MPNRGSVLSILGVAAGLLLAPLDAASQGAANVARIGYLSPVSASSDAANREAFGQGLRALGYVEGKNVLIEARHADGNLERLADLAADIVRLKVDVIVAATTTAVRAAQQATSTIPIVMAFAGDPAGDGLIASLARPGGNTTGLSAAVTEIAAKRVEYLRAVVPTASRFILLAAPSASISMVSATERAGAELGTRVSTVRVRDPGDVGRALKAAPNESVDGVIVDLAIRRSIAQIIELANARRLPTVSGPREFAANGGLLAYGADYADLFRRAADYVDRILRGAHPADLPVAQPTKFELVVNLRTAKKLGLTIPPSLLARADELIR
jgi:putative tryptophan/tyrosine transport system substrate-binding protein